MFIQTIGWETEKECLESKEEMTKKYSDPEKWLRTDMVCVEVTREEEDEQH